ncbi:MAG: transcriptional activator RfaH [Alphaproteobacteria bacterium]|nr:transcriptional activator RfaH [Alphaproteobacteria bacterium]
MQAWYVVRTKTQLEDRAVWHLRNQGFDVYLPRYRKQVRHARKVQTVLRPLFPGYVFVNMDLRRQRWRAVNGTVGVISLVQFGSEPMPVPAEVVDAIRANEDEAGAISLAPQGLVTGDRVRVRDGALADYTALLEEISDEKRAVLLLELMGREVRVSAPLESLVKAS